MTRNREKYYALHRQPFYRRSFGYQVGDFPITERLGRTSLALPFSSIMTESQVDTVCEQLIRAVEV